MTNRSQDSCDRRAWCVGVLRLGLGGAVCGGAAALVWRNRDGCRVAPACGPCARLQACDLPQAATARVARPNAKEHRDG